MEAVVEGKENIDCPINSDTRKFERKIEEEMVQHGRQIETDHPRNALKETEEELRPPPSKMTFAAVTKSALNISNDDLFAEDISDRLLKVKILRLDWQGFRNIDNLDVLTSVEDLYLQYNRIEKIKNLDTLFNLKFLALGNNEITRIENISHLKFLEFLDLSNNHIENIQLSEIPLQLKILNCKGNPCCSKNNYREIIISGLSELRILDEIRINTIDDSRPDSGVDEDTTNTSETPEGLDEKEEKETESCDTRDVYDMPSNQEQEFHEDRKYGPLTVATENIIAEAISNLNDMCNNTSLKAKEKFFKTRKHIQQRCRHRIAEQEKIFSQRTPRTVSNTSSLRSTDKK